MEKRKIKKYKHDFSRAFQRYRRIEPKLLSHYKGWIVAIEPKSGKFFVGENELEAAHLALEIFPFGKFGFFKVGYPIAHKIRPLRDNALREC